MKIPNKLGRRELLALSGLGLLPLHASAATPATEGGEESGCRFWSRVAGQSGNRASLDSPLLHEVSQVVQPCLALPRSGSDRIQMIREALGAAYHKDVGESLLPPNYILIWVDNHWEYVCLDVVAFRVAFGREATVEVAVEVNELLED